MTTDARAALEQLVAALRSHLEAAEQRRSERDPAVEAAYRRLAEAFEAYDEALYDAHDEVTPFVLYDDVEDEREDAELDDDLDESDLDDDLDDVDDSDIDDSDIDDSDVDDELEDIDESDLDDEDDDEVLEDLEESEASELEDGTRPYSDTSSRA